MPVLFWGATNAPWRCSVRVIGCLALVLLMILSGCAGNRDETDASWLDYASAVSGVVSAELHRPRGSCDRSQIDALWSEAGERMGEKDLRARSGVSADEWRRLDAENEAELAALLADHGWPQPCAITRKGATGLFYVVQHHSDPQFRQEALPVLEAFANEGRIRHSELALLIDRVLTHQDLPQLYGTQYRCDRSMGRWVPMPVEEPETLAERRREMGLIAAEVERRLINDRDDGRCLRQADQADEP